MKKRYVVAISIAVLLLVLSIFTAVASAITGAQMDAFVYSDATINCVSTGYCKHVNYPPGRQGIGNGWWIGWDKYYLYDGSVWQLKEERSRNGGLVWLHVYYLGG